MRHHIDLRSWTDGLRWGPSRVRDVRALFVSVALADVAQDFLFYHQRDTEADDEEREGGEGGRAPPAKWLKKFARRCVALPDPLPPLTRNSRRKADSPRRTSPISPRLSAPGAIDRSSDRENDRLIKQVR